MIVAAFRPPAALSCEARPWTPERLPTESRNEATGRVADQRRIPLVDKRALRMDVVAVRSFFSAHPVDGVGPGSTVATGSSLVTVPRTIPSPHTGQAACLHKLSTDLCTERLDARRGRRQTVRVTRYN
jgi:hypothetical protein